jgi:hypothetical protein
MLMSLMKQAVLSLLLLLLNLNLDQQHSMAGGSNGMSQRAGGVCMTTGMETGVSTTLKT